MAMNGVLQCRSERGFLICFLGSVNVKSSSNRGVFFPGLAALCVALCAPPLGVAATSNEGPTEVEVWAAAAAQRDMDPEFNGSALEAEAVVPPLKEVDVSAPLSTRSASNDSQ